jgi:hypothetical protein
MGELLEEVPRREAKQDRIHSTRGPLIPPGLDQKHFTLSLHGTPWMELPAIDFQIESSGPRELHAQALTDPDVGVSTHPAPTVQPVPGIAMANAQKVLAPDA